MASYRLDIAYDGAPFSGWARQPGRCTVQGELEAALTQLFGEAVGLTVAGRTDAGVHALAQVASFSVARSREPTTIARALNSLTPDAIAVTAVSEAEPGFDARRGALSRSYLYRVETAEFQSPFERGRALHHPFRLDRAKLERCAELITGRHDFTAFTPTQTEHTFFERTVLAASWQEAPGSILEFRVEANAFMRNMVRILVGTQLEVASGRRETDDLALLLEGAPRSRAGETAPPHGLYLSGVAYPAEGR